jgi:alpha-amylase/alpha-mannosidase (GH57 family)
MSRLAVLWHLHQPEYRDPDSGRPVMPWTRLHALRGYRDLFVETAERDPPVTLNVVPVLLDQLADYAAGGSDDHLDLTAVPADALTEAQIVQIRSTFVVGNEAMVRSSPAYARLAERVRGQERLGVGELRDVQVWSTLAWFGATALRDFPELVALRTWGRGFDEDAKQVMLKAQRVILEELPVWLARVSRGQRAAISVTPYHHPILPLLVDTAHAARNLGSIPTDVRFSWPDDARRQLLLAVQDFERRFGRRPQGLWPSEGAVSPEVVALAGEAGFSWLATDEGVLARSTHSTAMSPGGWDLGHGVVGFFRDRDLSDRIGFRYARVPAAQAVEDLIGAAAQRAEGGVLLVALDGENPWEAFEDAGAAFRRGLYEALESGPVPGISLDQAAKLPVVGRVSHLHTGSWIGANFGIWFGDEEDHEAWRRLAETRAAVERSPLREAGLRCLLPAQGSDWFWWYGPEFDTPFAHVFDALFRKHLAAAWRAIGEPEPAWVHEPIKRSAAARSVPPAGLVAPALTERPSWRQWRGAGRVQFSAGSAMAQGEEIVTGLEYGWDARDVLWLSIHLVRGRTVAAEQRWRICVGEASLELPDGARGPRAQVSWLSAVHAGDRLIVRATGGEVRVELLVEGEVVRSWPAHGTLTLQRPPQVAPLLFWSV